MTKNLKPQEISINIIGPMNISKEIPPSQMTYFVDGGIKHINKVPHLHKYEVLGDGDSGGKDFISNRLSKKKIFTDLSYTLESLPKSIKTLHLFGFTGGRLDHQLIVFGDIHYFLKKKTQLFLTVDSSIIAFAPGSFDLSVNSLFTLLSIEQNKISITGQCEYELKEKILLPPLSGLGLSNQGEGLIHIKNDLPVFLIKS